MIEPILWITAALAILAGLLWLRRAGQAIDPPEGDGASPAPDAAGRGLGPIWRPGIRAALRALLGR